MKVQIVWISGPGLRPAEVHTVRTDDLGEACQRIAAKLYGRGCYWIPNAGLSPDPTDTQYGNVGHYVKAAGATSIITGRIRISRLPEKGQP